MRTKARFMVPVLVRRGVNPPSDAAAPAGPTDLAVAGSGLEWTDNAITETGYRVEQSDTGTGGWSTTDDTLPANSDSYAGPLVIGKYYRVLANNANGDSSPSNVVGYLTALLLQDTFTAESDESLDAHTPDVDVHGNGWVEVSGAWTIYASGDFAGQTSFNASYRATVDVGTADVIIESNVRAKGGSSSERSTGYICARSSGGVWYYCGIYTYSTNPVTCGILRFNGTTFQSIVANASGTSNSSTIDETVFMRVTCSGDNIRLEIPSEGIDINGDDSTNNTATSHGISGFRSSPSGDITRNYDIEIYGSE